MDKEELLVRIRTTPLFFIIGRPRSGTTLLRTLFDAHPNAMAGLECPYVFPLYEKYGDVKVWTKKSLESFYSDLMDQSFWHFYKFRDLNIDFERLKQDVLRCVGETSFADLIKLVYPHYISDFPKKEILAFGDKNPDYTLRIGDLIKIFPEAKFIFLTRDYRDQLLSVKNAGFGKKGRKDSRVLYLWRKAFQVVSDVKLKYPGSFYSMRYEDFVKEPDYYFNAICEFIGIPYYSEVLDFHKHKEEAEFYPEEIMKRYQKSLFNPIDPNKVYGWKSKMTKKQIRLADTIVGSVAELAGYERQYKTPDMFMKARFYIRFSVIRPAYTFFKRK